MKKILCIYLLIHISVLLSYSQTELWRDTIGYVPTMLKVDQAGNVFVSGKHITQKFSPNGTELWRVGYGGEFTYGTGGIFPTTNGALYVTDDSLFEGGTRSLLKYDTNGNLLWSVQSSDYVTSVACTDLFGNIYFFGTIDGLHLTKFSSEGPIVMNSAIPEEWQVEVRSICVDSQMNCYLNVTVGNYSNPDSVGIVKINFDGSLAWRRMWLSYFENTTELKKNKTRFSSYQWYGNPFLNIPQLAVDRLGNSYLWGQEYQETNVYNTLDLGDYYSASNINSARIEFVTPSGRSKTIKIKGKGKVKFHYPSYGHKYTEENIDNEIFDLNISPLGQIYISTFLDQRKHVKGGALDEFTGAFDYSVQMFKKYKPSIKWKNNYLNYPGFYSDLFGGVGITDNVDGYFIPEPKPMNFALIDSVYYFRFDSTGQKSISSCWSYSEWSKTKGKLVFDNAGNVYAIRYDDPGNLQAGKHLVKYAPLKFGQSFQIQANFSPDESTIHQFELQQNYPNPFNPTTTIEFKLPEPGAVTLKVYNMLGQEVRILLNNEMMEDGEQSVEFDASGLPSGVYFYKITAQGEDNQQFQSIKRMILMK